MEQDAHGWHGGLFPHGGAADRERQRDRAAYRLSRIDLAHDETGSENLRSHGWKGRSLGSGVADLMLPIGYAARLPSGSRTSYRVHRPPKNRRVVAGHCNRIMLRSRRLR